MSENSFVPIKHSLYELRTLLGHIVRRLQNEVLLILRRRAEHGEQRVLRQFQ